MTHKTLTLNDRRYRIGESHHRAKLTDEQVDQMRELHEEQGIGYRTLAKQFDVSKRTVRDIVHYKTRAQTPEFWVRAKGKEQ
jgi:transposase